MIPQELTAESVLRAVNYLVAMLLSLSFHEAAHALVASLKGDSTAKDQGRLTLNPIAHIDPVGTVILPLIGALASLPVIGWAKPVPVDLRGMKNPRLANLQVSLAGPLSNLLLCIICVALLGYHRATGIPSQGSLLFPFVELVNAMVWVNAFLAFFNLIPLPPLDGAAMVTTLLPYRYASKFEEFVAPYGFLLLFIIMISGGLHWLPGVASGFVKLVMTMLGPLFSAT